MDLRRTMMELWTGKDRPYTAPLLRSPERKLYPEQMPVIMVPSLVHGPGAPPWGQGSGRSEDNSAVFACLIAISDSIVEAPPKVWRETQPGDREELPDHSLVGLFRNPHPRLSWSDLSWWLEWAKNVDGNAYLRKRRAGNEDTGNVVELWPISPRLIRPVTRKDSDEWIDYYRHEYAPGKFEQIAPHNLLHFRFGVDEQDHRLGLSPLKRLIREVATDVEATKFSDGLLRNFAVPGLVVTTPVDSELTREEAIDMKAQITADYGSDNRGNVALLRGGATMTAMGFSPNDMDLKILHQIPESRIAAVLRVPPAVAGLMIGLEQTSNYASFREVREMFTERTLIPTWRANDEVINRQLLPDFEADQRVFMASDISEVRALQEDRDKLFGRLNEAVKTGWVLPDEARSEIGYPAMKDAVKPQEQRPGGRTSDTEEESDQEAAALARRLLERKAKGEPLPVLFEMMAELAAPALEADVERFLQGQKRRMKRAVAGG